MSDRPEREPPNSSDDGSFFYIRIYKRPWKEWAGWSVWFLLMVFILQNAIASRKEGELRAAVIFWIFFSLLMLVGLIVYFVRKTELKNRLDDSDK